MINSILGQVKLAEKGANHMERDAQVKRACLMGQSWKTIIFNCKKIYDHMQLD